MEILVIDDVGVGVLPNVGARPGYKAEVDYVVTENNTVDVNYKATVKAVCSIRYIVIERDGQVVSEVYIDVTEGQYSVASFNSDCPIRLSYHLIPYDAEEAYTDAVAKGFVGTEGEWQRSLERESK